MAGATGIEPVVAAPQFVQKEASPKSRPHEVQKAM